MNYPEYDISDLYNSAQDGDYSYNEFSEFITQLIEHCILENEIEKGIAALVAAKGTKILSEKQSRVLERVVSRYENEECKLCGEKIPLNEVLNLDDNDGFCNYHKNQMDKDKD